MLDTYGDMKTRLAQILGTTEPEDMTLLGELINEGGEEVWYAFDWTERKKYDTFQTVAIVDHGSDYTVQATKGTDSWTCTPGAGQPDLDFGPLVDRKIIVPGFRGSWFWIKTGGLNVFTTDRVTDKDIDDTFMVYLDEYDLNPAAAMVIATEVSLFADDGRRIDEIYPADATRFWKSPPAAAYPARFMIEVQQPSTWQSGSVAPALPESLETFDNLRIRLGPSVPDDTYTIRYAYMSKWLKMENDTDIPPIARERRNLCILAAQIRALQLPEWHDTNLLERMEARFERQLKRAIRAHRPSRPRVTRVFPFDRPHSPMGIVYNLPPPESRGL